MGTGIQWTDATWNPVVGCSLVSPGCTNCYAMQMAGRLEAMGRPTYSGLAKKANGRTVWTGKVRTLPDRLQEPLKWKKPRRVFVNSMSDLFHPDVPFEFIDQVFAVMALTPQHTYQVLTKRPERMAEYLTRRVEDDDGWLVGSGAAEGVNGVIDSWAEGNCEWLNKMNVWSEDEGLLIARNIPDYFGSPLLLPNVWLGTSVEDQERADERIPHLLKCPAAVRFLSVEPLLGDLDLSAFFGGQYVGLPGDKVHPNYNFGIDWVIVGGESGHNARVCNVEWIRSIVRRCKAAGVAVFVKQLGAAPYRCAGNHDPSPVNPSRVDCGGECGYGCDKLSLRDRKGGDPEEWPDDLRVREVPNH